MHKTGAKDSDVKGFIAVRGKVHFIPQGIKKVFPAFNELHIKDCGLKRVSKSDFNEYHDLTTVAIYQNPELQVASDAFEELLNLERLGLPSNGLEVLPNLKTLTKLKLLSFGYNKLKVLSASDLASNVNLQKIYFPGNELKKIELTAVTNLAKLELADFSTNDCLDIFVPGNYTLKQLKKEIADKCNL